MGKEREMKTFFKGIIVGLGAVAPGLSGSILLVIFGLYQKVVSTVSHIFKDLKKNILFLLPLFLGIGVGIVVFSKLIAIPLEKFPMQTYYAFLGLILGAIPMLWREVRRDGFKKRHYAFSALSFVLAFFFFFFNKGLFPEIKDANFIQSVMLGLAVSAAYLVPGVDSFAILNTFGLYKLWLTSVGNLDFRVLLPAALGVAIGGVCISLIFNKLFSKWYTGTYSVIFGLFLAVILNFILTECPPPALNIPTLVSFIFLLLGFFFSLVFSRIENIIKYIKERKQGNARVL